MPFGGYANRVAWIDLSSGSVDYRPIDEADARHYIGGRGLGVKYLFDNGPDVDPVGPDNLLCLMTGPLTGTEVSMSGRLAAVTKSPLTGTCADSHVGGWTGARLKWAGLDGLAIRGRADNPTYLLVENGNVSLKDAAGIWGRGVHDTVRTMRAAHGDEASVLSIGPAGENLVLYANLVNEDDRAAGRNGTGCVAGSKNLKCVVIVGDQSARFRAEDRERWREVHGTVLKLITDNGVTGPREGGLSVYGTNVLMNIVNEAGGLPAHNAKETMFDGAEDISGEAIKEHILIDDPTCYACAVACKKKVEITEGPFQVLMESYEYESAWAFGANVGSNDRAAGAFLMDLCNDLGLDTIEHGNVLSVYLEATERGMTANGVTWGDGHGMVELTKLVAARDGIGDTLAGGATATANSLGDPNLAMSVKGMAIPAYDPRGIQGMGIGYATSNRGACHLRAYTPASELLGIPVKTDPLAAEGKGELTAIFQDLHAVGDSFNICKFSSFAEGMEEYAAQYSAITGIEVTADELAVTGERIYNLERHYNNLNGFGGEDDSLPRRFLTEPGTAPADQVCDLDLMKAEYYAKRGWDNGVVPEAKLRELQIVS
ncbi:MAG: aldehyde ferredoxin oxidoreductase family protein [Dehalococcoidia bacterium]|jgi:aldehyde:ferredoxin oxidoreductase|nr:aldehyde ferredoxin oxidoreductase family protein [Dehalococcoidia bacterium]